VRWPGLSSFPIFSKECEQLRFVFDSQAKLGDEEMEFIQKGYKRAIVGSTETAHNAMSKL
jgi:hypothetical protein